MHPKAPRLRVCRCTRGSNGFYVFDGTLEKVEAQDLTGCSGKCFQVWKEGHGSETKETHGKPSASAEDVKQVARKQEQTCGKLRKHKNLWEHPWETRSWCLPEHAGHATPSSNHQPTQPTPCLGKGAASRASATRTSLSSRRSNSRGAVFLLTR